MAYEFDQMAAERAENLAWHHLFRHYSHVPDVKIEHNRHGME